MDFNFKSQICTDKVQSERLLALGLKKETADCHYPISMLDGQPCDCIKIGNPSEQKYHAFPAWSLGRLIEIMRMKASSQIVPLDDTFDRLIEGIETRIKEGYFNKEYLV